MFDWLGLSPSALQIIGCVMIGLACLLFVFLIIIMIKSFKEIKKEKTEKPIEKVKTTNDLKAEIKESNIKEIEAPKEETTVENFYISKLKKLTDEEKEYYTEIKNAVLGYNKFINTLTVDGETFKYFNRTFGAIAVKNGKLKFYLKLSKKDLDQRFNNEPSEFKKYQRTPMEFVLDKDVELRKAKKSLEDLAEELELETPENIKSLSFATLIKKFD